MKIPFFFMLGGLYLMSGLASCSDREMPALQEAPEVEAPEAWHDKTREQPYPKLSNELYLNPAPLILPQSLKTGERVQFALSQNPDFPEAETQFSEPRKWCMFNPHRRLAEGTWYWRYRNVAADGTVEGWSEPVEFEVKASTPVFVTPGFEIFRQGRSTAHPRLYAFLDQWQDDARARLRSHEEYRALVNRAETAVSADEQAWLSSFSETSMSTAAQRTEFLYQACLLTCDSRYADKLEAILDAFLSRGFSDRELFLSNFCATNIAYTVLAPYDLLYNRLDAGQRQAAEQLLMRVARYYYEAYCGMQENHIFDNHFWQQNFRVLFQIAYCLADKEAVGPEVLEMLEYYYELWTARAPASGFNRDGAWINGTGYFEANVRTLFYMPMLLSNATRFDFLQHPWYQSAGQAIAYNFPPGSCTTGFGDGSERREEPHRSYAAFADFLARELGDGYAGWYASACADIVKTDVDLRLYRMCRYRTYATDFPASAPKLKWYKDIGEVVMHSNLASTENNLSLAFRSSTFGSGSHTLADQNSFNLLYGGKEVYYHTGYYLNFSDAHNLMSYRHTRAHNSILVDGIGQPFSTEGYGMLLRAAGGEHIGYCLGDASHAYCGISEDPMWIESFQKAGIEQTPENGFGETPLTKYRRQMIMLYPDIVLIYDELEASRPVRWDWLLHSPVQFGIDKNVFTSHVETGVAVAQMFSDAMFEVSQTDQFVVPPGEGYPNQWHLTAAFSNNSACRILTVVQIKNSEEEALPVTRDGCCVTCGDWTIYVNLDPSSAECLQVTNATVPVVYSYGSDNVQTDSGVYLRQFRGSSVLYDEIDGQYQVVEQIDQSPMSSRRG